MTNEQYGCIYESNCNGTSPMTKKLCGGEYGVNAIMMCPFYVANELDNDPVMTEIREVARSKSISTIANNQEDPERGRVILDMAIEHPSR